MISLLIHAFLGVVTIVLALYFNKHLYGGGSKAKGLSGWETLYYVLAVASVCCGWYFNIQYMAWAGEKAGWVDFTEQLFTNPAAGSGSQDLLFTNCLFFPLWTIIDGPRRGLKHAWIWFVMSLFTSFGFAMGMYLAAVERQLRYNAAQSK